ncbi:hypothetical protein CHELA1G11_13460 [Hyphomicrobiales bacterium]|nr:hypothetical protein CHELA1G11_13460 [Hyphomicrobiales bacterium]
MRASSLALTIFERGRRPAGHSSINCNELSRQYQKCNAATDPGKSRHPLSTPSTYTAGCFDLSLQYLRVEGFDNIVVNTGALGRDDALRLGFSRHHDKTHAVECRIGSDELDKFKAAHRLHVPIGNDQSILLELKLGQSAFTIRRLVDVMKANLLKEIPNNADHRLEIIDDENRHCKVKHHGSSKWIRRAVWNNPNQTGDRARSAILPARTSALNGSQPPARLIEK